MSRNRAEVARPVDPWRLRLERVRGATGFDGLERISTQTLMDVLEILRSGGYLKVALVALEGVPEKTPPPANTQP